LELYLLIAFGLTMLCIPLFFAPLKFMDGYLLPQFGIGAIGISVSLIFYLMLGKFNLSFTVLLVMLYFFYLVLTCSWSTVQHNSMRELPLIFCCLIGFVIAITLFENKENMVAISLIAFVVSMFTSLYGIGQKFLFDPLFPERLASQERLYKGLPKIQIPKCFQNKKFKDSRVISTMGNTNFAAGFFLTTIPFLIYLSFEVSMFFLLSILVVITVIILTESRAGLLSLLGSAVFFLILISKRGLVFDGITAVWCYLPIELCLAGIIFLLIMGSYYILNSKKLKAIYKSLSEDNPLNTMLDFEHGDKYHPIAHLRYRIRYVSAAVELILRKPLHGYGLRTYRKEVYSAQGRLNIKDKGEFLGEAYQTPQPREVHNDFVENFVEGGIIGGGLFLVIFGMVFFGGVLNTEVGSTKDFLLISALCAGITGIAIDAIFFFPFRVAASGLYFWVALALLAGVSTTIVTSAFVIHPIFILFVFFILVGFIWEGVIKPNLGNYFFTKYNFAKYGNKKEGYLMKALKYCPRETIFRTHAMIGYANLFPEEAEEQAETMRQHYDGMTPAWVMAFNSGSAKKKLKQYKDAMKFFSESLFYLPSFNESRMEAVSIQPYLPLQIRRRFILKKIGQKNEVTLTNMMQNIEMIKQQSQQQLQNNETNMLNIVLGEARRLNIPEDWPFDFETKQFYEPNEIPGGKTIMEAGPARVKILWVANQPLPQI